MPDANAAQSRSFAPHLQSPINYVIEQSRRSATEQFLTEQTFTILETNIERAREIIDEQYWRHLEINWASLKSDYPEVNAYDVSFQEFVRSHPSLNLPHEYFKQRASGRHTRRSIDVAAGSVVPDPKKDPLIYLQYQANQTKRAYLKAYTQTHADELEGMSVNDRQAKLDEVSSRFELEALQYQYQEFVQEYPQYAEKIRANVTSLIEQKQSFVDTKYQKTITEPETDIAIAESLSNIRLRQNAQQVFADNQQLDQHLQHHKMWVALPPRKRAPIILGAAYGVTSAFVPGLVQQTGDPRFAYSSAGYTSGAYRDYAAQLRSDYLNEDGQWTDAKFEGAYKNALEWQASLSEYESQHPVLKTITENYHKHKQTLLPMDEDANPVLFRPGSNKTFSTAERIDRAAGFLKPDNQQTYPQWQQSQRLQVRNLFNTGQLNILSNANKQVILGSRQALGRLQNVVSKRTKETLVANVKKLGNQAAKAVATKLVQIAGSAALKSITSFITGGTAAVFFIAKAGWDYFRKNKTKVLGLLFYLQFQLAALLKALLNPATLISTVGGAYLGGTVGGITGAAAGGAVGFAGEKALTSQFGTATNAAGEIAHTVTEGAVTQTAINPMSGNIIQVRSGGLLDAVTPELPGTAFFATTVVGPFATVFILAFFTLMTIFSSFTVPNPQAPQWGIPGNSNVPEFFPSPGAPPGSNPPPGQDDNAYTGPLRDIISEAATKACIPSAFLTAVMQVEARGAFNFDQSQITRFDTYNWWQNAQPGNLNCYSADLGGECRTGYCYDTCSTSGLCGVDVRGVTQFVSTTFYGSQCTSLEGLGTGNSCKAVNSPAHFITSKIRNDDTYVPNRCRVTDAIYAGAFLLARNSQAVGFNAADDYSCTYDANRWAPDAAKESICRAARAYCGSCGLVESPSHQYHNTGQPCESVYGGSPSSACGGADSIGYCNLVYQNYVNNLNGT